MDEQGLSEKLIRENQELKARLAESHQAQAQWQAQAQATERLLAKEQQARHQAELAGKQANFSAHLSSFVTGAFDYSANLEKLVRLLTAEFADWVAVDLLNESGSLERAAVASQDFRQEEFLRASYKHYPLNLKGPHPVAQALRESKARLVKTPGVSPFESDFDPDGPASELTYSGHDQSYILAPLLTGTETLGIFIFVRMTNRPPFEAADLALAEDLATKVAMMVQNSRLYVKLQAALENQQELNYFKDLYLSILSHELRNPLASIRGYTQVIGRSLKSRQNSTITAEADLEPLTQLEFDKEFRALNILINQSDRMNRMVNELLDFSRIQKNTFELNYMTTVDLVELIETIVEQQSMVVKTHPFEVTTSQPQIKGVMDENHLEQVFNNLISNAVKYSPNGSPVNIDLQFQPAPPDREDAVDYVLVAVRDYGQGIDREALPHLFERYYRVRTEKNRMVQGLGLGLYICKEIVRQHGGELWVESEIDEGSTFYVRLPLQPLPK